MDCGGCRNLKCASRITIWAMGSCSDDGGLKTVETNPMSRVCINILMWCEHVVIGPEEDEDEGEEEVQEEDEEDA